MTTQPSFLPDHVQGFFLARSGIRGRCVRLGLALDAIITRHAYPDAVAALLAESITLAVMLAYMLKYEGIFTLQTRGDGPVEFLVVDLAKGGHLRGYAKFDAEKVRLAGVGSALLLGKGHLAFTVDQGGQMDRYQGVVEIIGRDMAACVKNYFRQSEQIDTAFRVHVGKDAQGRWCAGGLMLQRLPEGGGYAANNNLTEGMPTPEEREEDWHRANALMETSSDAELFDGGLETARFLTRLFHEENLELDAPQPLADQCRCSRGRVAMVLSSLKQGELRAMLVNGKVEVTCEFCSTAYHFDESQLDQLVAGPGVRE